MVKIQTLGGELWMERLEFNFASVAVAATVNGDSLFSKAGQVVSISWVGSQTNGNIAKPYTVNFMQNGTTGVLNSADFNDSSVIFTGLRCRFTNNDLVLTNGAFIVATIILKRSGR